MPILTRRHLLATGLVATGAALAAPVLAQGGTQNAARNASQTPEPWILPLDYVPRIVRLAGDYTPGDIHVDPNLFALYHIQPDGSAMRYVVGVGRGNLYESGVFTVGAKKEWPTWKPTPEMVERNPAAYGKWKDAAMPGGPTNPLGARALYLFVPGGGDSMLRIHGTPQPRTIGTAVSNGCVRLVNEHITRLYEQVQMGAKVVLYSKTTLA